MKPRVYLSRRNLLALLSKLDRKAEGEDTACAIVKNDKAHPKYPQTMASIEVVAIEDDEYYTGRIAGAVHPKDEPVSITAAMVSELRDKTSAPMLAAKKALIICNGDMGKAEAYLADPSNWNHRYL